MEQRVCDFILLDCNLPDGSGFLMDSFAVHLLETASANEEVVHSSNDSSGYGKAQQVTQNLQHET